MSKEELREHGVRNLDQYFLQEDDVRARFEQKLRDCFEQYKAEWLQKPVAALIEDAEEIASVQRMFKELPEAVTDEDAAYLLRFKNPLEVVSDYWTSMNGSGTVVDDDMSHILWELRDRQDAEADYEMEPEYYAPAEPQSQAPELTM
ncbi:MAG: DUF3848 domain-containing protein [Ruminococcaceae bacterium]|nr:DUF3848 domain-containing protein [Oscillospiraceae bacterium]